MKGLKSVISFEYTNIVKRKSYIISLAFYVVIILAINFIPAIIDFFSRDDAPVGIVANHAVILDEAPAHNFDPALLAEFFPEYNWAQVHNAQQLEEAVISGQAAFGLRFTDVNNVQMLTTDAAFAPSPHLLELLMREVANRHISDIHLSLADMDMTINHEFVALAQDEPLAGIDPDMLIGPAGSIVGNFALIIGIIAVMSSGGTIMASVMKEKTSKIVELLFTSASPTAIMLGKVIASALVALTTGIVLITATMVIVQFTDMGEVVIDAGILYAYPPILFVYIIIFIILAFISLSFIYAGLAATVSDTQESSTLAVMPMFIVLGAFYLGMGMLGNPSFISETFVRVISFIPFVSPFAMIARLNTMLLPTAEILLIIGLNMIYAVGAALLSARIYRMCIMLFGTKINLRFLFKRLTGR
ncbi:MAG: ABC transporter permease [Clostridiales bacterium]|jgi:ABC-2 type transport system permease protein|nr:ABC transporter permease [Clostridiales bacterium]